MCIQVILFTNGIFNVFLKTKTRVVSLIYQLNEPCYTHREMRVDREWQWKILSFLEVPLIWQTAITSRPELGKRVLKFSSESLFPIYTASFRVIATYHQITSVQNNPSTVLVHYWHFCVAFYFWIIGNLNLDRTIVPCAVRDHNPRRMCPSAAAETSAAWWQ